MSDLANQTPSRITIHCSASKNGDNSVDIETIRGWHKARGFSDVGYHSVIKCDGEVQRGRPLNIMGAHVEGENRGNIGICLIGTDRFTRRQLDALRSYLDSIFMNFSIPKHEIWCHYEFKSAQLQGKTCPNMSVHRLYTWYYCHDESAIDQYLLKE